MRKNHFEARSAAGAMTVEFAITSVILILLLMGVVEWARMLFYWNTAVEATRDAARTAVVCDLDAAAVRRRITTLLPMVAAADVDVQYLPAGCSAHAAPLCETVTVSFRPEVVIVKTYIPFVPFQSIAMPDFSTTLTTESLQSSPGGVANPRC